MRADYILQVLQVVKFVYSLSYFLRLLLELLLICLSERLAAHVLHFKILEVLLFAHEGLS